MLPKKICDLNIETKTDVSNVNVSSYTILFVDLPYTNIHASYSQFSKYPSSGVNLTPEPDSTPIIALF